MGTLQLLRNSTLLIQFLAMHSIQTIDYSAFKKLSNFPTRSENVGGNIVSTSETNTIALPFSAVLEMEEILLIEGTEGSNALQFFSKITTQFSQNLFIPPLFSLRSKSDSYLQEN